MYQGRTGISTTNGWVWYVIFCFTLPAFFLTSLVYFGYRQIRGIRDEAYLTPWLMWLAFWVTVLVVVLLNGGW